AAYGRSVANVRELDLQPPGVPGTQPGEIALDSGTGKVIQHQNLRTLRQQPVGQVGTDESGAARDQRERLLVEARAPGHATRPRRRSSSSAASVRSSVRCPSSQAP